jgi:hypothetical protein
MTHQVWIRGASKEYLAILPEWEISIESEALQQIIKATIFL